MGRRTPGALRSPRTEGDPATANITLLLAGGVLLALLLPFVLYSAASDEAVRESKLFLAAVAAALVLAGLGREPALPALRRSWLLPIAALAGLVLLSALANASGGLDPLTAVALLAPFPLVAAGASRAGATVATRALTALSWCGAATGALAVVQRFGGVLRMPIAASEPRFFATGLVGNPGDVGAALVLPALILWHRAASGSSGRLAALGGFAAVLAGVGSTEAIGPLLAIAGGLAAHTLLDARRRAPAAAVALLVALLAAAVTGAGGRALRKLGELRSGDVSSAFTQRDIGVMAALQMIRTSPFLGVGPGAYENAFVPARLEAEARLKRRLIHQSDASQFENAHSEPLDVAAECGLPAAALAAGLAGALVVTLVRRHRAGAADTDPPPADLLAALVLAFGVLCLGSFPLRMPPALIPAAFVTGLALRCAGAVEDVTSPRKAPAVAAGAALPLALVAAARFASVQLQARGEMELRSVPIAGEYREQLIADARRHLGLAARLRPRKATALLELGSVLGLSGETRRAWDLTRRALAVGERAETDVALGILASNAGERAAARELYVRGVWVLPKAIELLPDDARDGEVEAAVEAHERALPRGGAPPGLPGLVREGRTPATLR